MTALSAQRSLVPQNAAANVPMSAMTGCIAAFKIVTKGSNGPEADESAMGGMRTFAAIHTKVGYAQIVSFANSGRYARPDIGVECS